MAKPQARELEVKRRSWVTKNMLRITLGGDGLEDFPQGQESAYIKLLFPQGGDARPLMRTYTIRDQRPEEIDVDFVMHEEHGPASAWASEAEPGDRILVAGPGRGSLSVRTATGSTSGIGLAIAAGLAASGATITIVGRDQAKIDQALATIAK